MINLSRKIYSSIKSWKNTYHHESTYKQFHDFTMVPPQSYKHNLALAEQVRGVQGCIVECGVWRGGMIAGIASILGNGRSYFLFDSFEGLPPAKDIDGAAALEWQKDIKSLTYYDNCAAPLEMAEQAMKIAKADSFQLIQGWFENTLPDFEFSEEIALLRLDADWYESTTICLENLFNKVCTNGLILLDDYYIWDGCSRALHDFLSHYSKTERIRNYGDICYIKKN